MAKQKSSHKKLTRRQVARHEKEQNIQRTITWIAIVVSVVVVLVLSYGFINELLIHGRKPVAQIGNVVIRTSDFQKRQRYERAMLEVEASNAQQAITSLQQEGNEGLESLLQQYQMYLSSLQQQLAPEYAELFGEQILDKMVEEELVRQEAAARGIAVDQVEVEKQIELAMGYDREAAAAITETETLTNTAAQMTEKEYQDQYRNFKDIILEGRIPESTYRDIMAAQWLRTKVQEAIGEEAESIVDQVEATLLITETEEGALVLQSRINDGGELPETLVEELTADESVTSTGYTLPWLPVGYLSSQMGEDIERVAFNTPVGQAAEPVLGTDGNYYVIYVSGHEERELSESLLSDAQLQLYNQWLEEQKTNVVEYFDWQEAVVTD